MNPAGYFTAGMLFGATIGVLMMCLAIMAKRNDDEGGDE